MQQHLSRHLRCWETLACDAGLAHNRRCGRSACRIICHAGLAPSRRLHTLQGWAINIIVAGSHAAYPSAKSQEHQALRQLKPSQVPSPAQCLCRVRKLYHRRIANSSSARIFEAHLVSRLALSTRAAPPVSDLSLILSGFSRVPSCTF